MIKRYVPLHALNAAEKRMLLAAWAAGIAQGFAQSHATNTLPFSRLSFGLSEAEMANVLWAAERRGHLGGADVARELQDLGGAQPLVHMGVVDHHVVAQKPHAGRPAGHALGHQAAGHLADLGDVEDFADFGVTQELLALEHTFTDGFEASELIQVFSRRRIGT